MPANHFRLGLFFICIAVLSWGILPIALKLSTGFIDPVTLTWFRFLVAFVLCIGWQHYRKKLSEFRQVTAKQWSRLAIMALFSMANYISFVYSLNHLAPGQAQLNFQTAPFFLAFGGVLFFKESLKPIQMMCFATLALGMMLFFHPYLNLSETLADQENASIWTGILLIQFSALSWTSYALMQKSLASHLSPNNILLFVYTFGLLVMLPFCDFSHFEHLTNDQWLIALYCAINTLVAYACFAQSMQYWPTSQVGPMVALTPILSFASTSTVVYFNWWPNMIKSDQLDQLSIFGVLVVILSVFGIQILPKYLEKRQIRRLNID